MKNKVHLISILFVLGLLTACSSSTATQETGIPDSLPCGEEVEWETAVSILHQGEVEQVVQLHSLEVTLILKDGCEIKTVEPVIDDIFNEVVNCGAPCADMILATE